MEALDSYVNNMEKYRPIFYHYLDGFGKVDVGYGQCYNFLKKCGQNFVRGENITIGSTIESNVMGNYDNIFNIILFIYYTF